MKQPKGVGRAVRPAAEWTIARYDLHLFIAGTTPRSALALSIVSAICEEHLKGRYELAVVDVYQQPELAKAAQVIAVPTLIKRAPLPVKKLVGDLSNRALVLFGLDILETHEKGQ